MTPEAVMWEAVIARAVDDVLVPHDTGATFAEQCDALDWLTSDNTGMAGFIWTCRLCGVEPEAIRRRVRDAGVLWV